VLSASILWLKRSRSERLMGRVEVYAASGPIDTSSGTAWVDLGMTSFDSGDYVLEIRATTWQ